MDSLPSELPGKPQLLVIKILNMSELRLAKLIEVSDITGYYTAVIVVQSLNHVRLFATPWTIQSVEFSRSEYWSM